MRKLNYFTTYFYGQRVSQFALPRYDGSSFLYLCARTRASVSCSIGKTEYPTLSPYFSGIIPRMLLLFSQVIPRNLPY